MQSLRKYNIFREIKTNQDLEDLKNNVEIYVYIDLSFFFHIKDLFFLCLAFPL